ncbi:MAG: XdhC family protein [Rhodospirillales bacterium]|nr:XdhC family protein [Rhodospirillales bacterium]
MQRRTLDALTRAKTDQRPVALVTDIGNGSQALLDREGHSLTGDLELPGALIPAVEAAIAADRSGLDDNSGLFIQVFNPPLRLIVVGAVHIAQALIPMARVMGYEVTVVDPRRSWANAERFPGVILTHAWPDEALDALAPDHRTAVVALTHDPKLDDPALVRALASNAFYIGALGSTRTHGKRQIRLQESGVDSQSFGRIDGPIGLAIGAKSPAEIALSILAKMTQVRHGAPPLVQAA